MTRTNKTSRRQLSAANLREVKGGLMPYNTQFSLPYREARQEKERIAPRIRQVAI